MPTTTSQAFYAETYQTHRSFIITVIRRCGIPADLLQDVAQEIFADIWEKEGLKKFDLSLSSTNDFDRALRKYLAAYASLKSLGWRDRYLRQRRREIAIDPSDQEPIWVSDGESGVESNGLLDLLLEETSGDVREFIQVASEHDSYTSARSYLVSQGWDTPRIAHAVRYARRATRRLVS